MVADLKAKWGFDVYVNTSIFLSQRYLVLSDDLKLCRHLWLEEDSFSNNL